MIPCWGSAENRAFEDIANGNLDGTEERRLAACAAATMVCHPVYCMYESALCPQLAARLDVSVGGGPAECLRYGFTAVLSASSAYGLI